MPCRMLCCAVLSLGVVVWCLALLQLPTPCACLTQLLHPPLLLKRPRLLLKRDKNRKDKERLENGPEDSQQEVEDADEVRDSQGGGA